MINLFTSFVFVNLVTLTVILVESDAIAQTTQFDVLNSNVGSNKNIVWNTSGFGAGFGHKMYNFDPGGRTLLKIASRHNTATWTDLMTFSSDGQVGIGTSDPQAKFHLIEDQLLGSTAGNIRLLTRISGKTAGNSFMNNLWMYRDAAGSNWLTSRLHDGISIDNSFLTPGSDTRTWWERDPYNDIQSWGNANATYLTINAGNVGIGTTTLTSRLTVKGKIHAEEVKVDLNVPGPDYVFENHYQLRSLDETEKFVRENKHLPGIPSAADMEENGINLSEMNMKLLQKVEELTLYIINQNKLLKEEKKKNEKLEDQIEELRGK